MALLCVEVALPRAGGALSRPAAGDGFGGGGAAVPEVVVTIDVATLATGAPGRCELDDGPQLTVAEARRLACDARLVHVHVDGDGSPLDIGRATRTVPPSLRTALRVRDGGCGFPGCGATSAYWTDAHHLVHWADGGPTSLDNLTSC